MTGTFSERRVVVLVIHAGCFDDVAGEVNDRCTGVGSCELEGFVFDKLGELVNEADFAIFEGTVSVLGDDDFGNASG